MRLMRTSGKGGDVHSLIERWGQNIPWSIAVHDDVLWPKAPDSFGNAVLEHLPVCGIAKVPCRPHRHRGHSRKAVEEDLIDISWTDRPQLETLTRENVKTFLGAWSAIGLSVGEPMTEECLKALIEEQPTLQAR